MLEIAEESLRPYWWDESAETWIVGGTTPEGTHGESFFAGIDSNPDGFGRGFVGLNTVENYLWANINHASIYGAGGVAVPEPSTLASLLGLCLVGLGLLATSRSIG